VPSMEEADGRVTILGESMQAGRHETQRQTGGQELN
jgi:hypothetical protein